VAFHQAHFDPASTVLVIVGGVDGERVRDGVEVALGGWNAAAGNTAPKGGGLPAALPGIAAAPGPGSTEWAVHTMADKAQADVAIAHPGLRRLDDDYYAAAVMNMILGSFAMGGRLGRVIREEKGMAYYVHSSLGAGVGPGPFMVRAGVHPANVDLAVDCALEEMRRIQREPVTDEELSDATSAIVRSLPRNLETNEGMAAALHSIEQYQLGLDHIDRFPDIIAGVTAEQVLEVAARRLFPDRCVIAVAGPYPPAAEATVRAAGDAEPAATGEAPAPDATIEASGNDAKEG